MFRGWALQWFGATLPWRPVALVVAAALSTWIFVDGHDREGWWRTLDLVVFSLTCLVLTLRTGGLEAAIVLHTLNNTVIGVLQLTTLQLTTPWVGALDQAPEGVLPVVLTVIMHAGALLLVEWQWRRSGHSNRSGV